MAGSSFGTLFRFTTWGESHGPAIGCVVDGVPSLLELDAGDIQHWLDRRKPGQSKWTTQRREPDRVEILSGVFEGRTTGAPVSLLIRNEDQRSKDYGDIAQMYRPGHADYTYDKKYGIRDHRGGGRSSARETAMRVAAGAIARKILGRSIRVRGCMVQMGGDRIERDHFDPAVIDANPFWCPDAAAAERWEGLLAGVRKSGSSVGAVIEVVASGVPAGLGEPIYDKLDADIAKAMMSINAVKGVEIGAGMAAATLSGEANVVRFAVKPTSSILTPRRTVTRRGEETEIVTKGRHDPCVGIRAVPVGEAMLAIVLADHLLRHRGIFGAPG